MSHTEQNWCIECRVKVCQTCQDFSGRGKLKIIHSIRQFKFVLKILQKNREIEFGWSPKYRYKVILGVLMLFSFVRSHYPERSSVLDFKDHATHDLVIAMQFFVYF